MAWNDNLRLFASAGASKQHNTFYDYYNFNPFSGTDHVKCNDQEVDMEKSLLDNTVNNSSSSSNNNNNNNNDNKERKRRMRWDQIESLERSFQEEIKLEPERKMKLARELGLHPRKVAVWFQNRRARWKTKQLENLYDALKQEFDVVSREKQKLQEEVIKLKGRLENEAAVVIQGSALCTEAPSVEETVESKSVVISNANILYGGANYHQISNCNYVFAADDDYNPALASYWGSLPGYP